MRCAKADWTETCRLCVDRESCPVIKEVLRLRRILETLGVTYSIHDEVIEVW